MKADEKKCPRCAEIIKKQALLCKHCGHEFSQDELLKQKTVDAKDTKNGAIGCVAVVALLLLVGMCSSGGQSGGNSQDPVLNGAEAASEPGAATQAKYLEQLRREVSALEKHSPLDTSSWTTKEGITIQVALIGAWAKLYSDGAGYALTSRDQALRQRFKKLVSAEQVRRFPALRAAQARIFDRGMWENDVDVAVLGTGNRNLRVTGGIFAANRNIKAGYEALQETASALRFGRVTFEWYRGSAGTYYDLKPLGDGVVATLGGSGWTEMD